jgi:prepilin-type N-terminal cleavage/methylation domain-containing protein
MTFRTRTHRAPAGFTLIELLVVISIIAILLALTGVVYQKSIENQRNRSTDDLANRLQPALEAEYDAIVQACAKERRDGKIPPGVVAYCEGDMDRAQAVWTAARLWRAFPTSFAEALSPIYISHNAAGTYSVGTSPPAGDTVDFYSPALATFAEVATLGNGVKPGDESAILLYIILAKRSAGNSGGFAADDVTNGMQTDVVCSSGKSGRAFRDAWGYPMIYQRWAFAAAELQAPPYVDAKAIYKDPLDPLGKVSATWTSPQGQVRSQQMSRALQFTGTNRIITVVSPGKDGVFDPNLAGDDLVGYRIRRLGNKGK